MKPRCTKGKERRISRWEHEAILDVVQERFEGAPEAMRLRRQTVEHVFRALKGWMGSNHFLTKTQPRVSTEMSLQVLAYNWKRVITILGTAKLIKAMRAQGESPSCFVHSRCIFNLWQRLRSSRQASPPQHQARAFPHGLDPNPLFGPLHS